MSRRFNEALREPCDVWQNLTLHAKQISKVAHLTRFLAILGPCISTQCGQDTLLCSRPQHGLPSCQLLSPDGRQCPDVLSFRAFILQCQPWFVNWLRPRATAVQTLDATFSSDDAHRLELLLSLLGR